MRERCFPSNFLFSDGYVFLFSDGYVFWAKVPHAPPLFGGSQIAALSDACRRAEQARRDSVSRLAPVQSKEQDMTEELARMKEKDRLRPFVHFFGRGKGANYLLPRKLGPIPDPAVPRLRKEYVEELRKRHEEEASRLEVQLAREQRARREDQVSSSLGPVMLINL